MWESGRIPPPLPGGPVKAYARAKFNVTNSFFANNLRMRRDPDLVVVLACCLIKTLRSKLIMAQSSEVGLPCYLERRSNSQTALLILPVKGYQLSPNKLTSVVSSPQIPAGTPHRQPPPCACRRASANEGLQPRAGVQTGGQHGDQPGASASPGAEAGAGAGGGECGQEGRRPGARGRAEAGADRKPSCALQEDWGSCREYCRIWSALWLRILKL